MATKLKNLRIKKVDFVDEGANPDAHIGMMKSKNGEGKPAAEGDSRKEEPVGVLKKLFGFIGKAAGIGQDEIDSALEEIRKSDSVSFNEKINEFNSRKIADEIWDVCFALQSSLCSILNDGDLDSAGTEAAMKGSLAEFYAVAQLAVTQWSGGKEAHIIWKGEMSGADLEVMKAAVGRINESIEKACKGHEPGNKEKPKGDEEEMKIDKSKLTDAERAFLESIEKRYGAEGGEAPGNGSAGAEAAASPTGQTPTTVSAAEPTVTKSVAKPADGAGITASSEEADGIYKGLHPAVRAELESLKKFREDAEERELAQVAKKYTLIGRKEEDLLPLFKSLKAAGGTAYADMIAVLDQAVETVEKSGAFSEIGKSGHGSANPDSAEARIDAIAKGYMEKDASLDYNTAVAKAWENNMDILDQYDDEAGF